MGRVEQGMKVVESCWLGILGGLTTITQVFDL